MRGLTFLSHPIINCHHLNILTETNGKLAASETKKDELC